MCNDELCLRWSWIARTAPRFLLVGCLLALVAPPALARDAAGIENDMQIGSRQGNGPLSGQLQRLAQGTEKFKTTFDGALQPPKHPKYFVYRPEILTREGPSARYASKFSLSDGQEITALGSVAEKDIEWVKILTTNGHAAFIPLIDLLTYDQYTKRLQLLDLRDKYARLYERAEASHGPLAQHAGFYTSCYPEDTKSPGSALGVWLVWFEGNRYFISESALRPDDVSEMDLRPHKIMHIKPTTQQPGGPVQFYRRPDGELAGFKHSRYYACGDDGGCMSVPKCGNPRGYYERIKRWWEDYIELVQRG